MAGAFLRFCAALVLVFQIVYTPIHLYYEPHSDEAESSATAPQSATIALVDDEGHDGDEHREHSAAQHQLKALRSDRAALPDMVLVPLVVCLVADLDKPQAQGLGFSGLSPPELSRSWQFHFRAALPVRAPSAIS